MNNSKLNELLKAYKDGDVEAFAAVYSGLKRQVFSISYSVLNNYHKAEDIMEDTFIKVMEKIDYYKEGSNAKAFILTIAKNLSINEYNRQKRIVVMNNNLIDDIYSDGEMYIEDLNTPLLLLAREILSTDEYKILILRVVSELKHKEIAQMLNRPIGTILWIYNKAIKKLRSEMENRGIGNYY